MDWTNVFQSVITAVALAIIFGIAQLFRRLSTLETKVDPVVSWYLKTSMDALKLATNPTSERLAELADRYIATVSGKGRISPEEKDELINGLLEIYNDPHSLKRQSASMSLRFIESLEGVRLLPIERQREH